MHRSSFRVLISLVACLACTPTPAILPSPVAERAPVVRPLVVEAPAPFTPTIVRFSPDSAARLAKSGRDSVHPQLFNGLELKLWAPESMMVDPTTLTVDDLGRVYVARTERTNRDEIDIRAHPDWMVPSIGFRDVEDKRAFYKSILAPEKSAQNQWLKDWNGDGSRDWRDLTVHKESIYRLEDTNNDGIADVSQVILKDFNDLVTDVAHGITTFRGDLFLTLSPDLWRLRDTNGDGVIDTRESLAHGSGVHIGFGGHGLSGPIIGPDGRLYWKEGDLGVNIITREGRHLDNPNSAVIMRANPDGTEAEIFATGMRNPYEFAFDEYGNLISPDNDGDHPGEVERLLYVVDGMDSGWRINWQFGKYVDPDNNSYKVWMAENMFKPRFTGQAAYITPPIAPWHDGPTGFAYNPGTALNESWRNYFFTSVFTGSATSASLHGFTLAPDGAGFRLAEDKLIESGLLLTGVKFGPDGKLYLADWVTGWDPKDRGRIWTLDVSDGATSHARVLTRALLAESFGSRSTSSVAALLSNPDMRVRSKAQFELVDRRAIPELLLAARQTKHQLERIHGIWGIAQLSRQDITRAVSLVPFLTDGDPEIRAQAAKMLGDLRYSPAAPAMLPLMTDPVARVRFFMTEALGRLKYQPAISAIVTMLADNDDEDVYLRHAGVTALSRIGVAEPLIALAGHPQQAVRIAAVVALRRMRNPGVARFLADKDEMVVTEAARAINDDGGIIDALPSLAAILDNTFHSEALVRRVISANLRAGSDDAARRIARYALSASADDNMRIEAISVLGVWPKPSVLDRVDGTNIGQAVRDSAAARSALTSIVDSVFRNGTTGTQVAVAEAIGRLRLQSAASLLFDKVRSAQAAPVRVASLRALAALGDPRTEEALRLALQDQDATVRSAAIAAIPPLKLSESTTTSLLGSVLLGNATVPEQQAALTALSRVQGNTSVEMFGRLVDQLVAGKIAPEVQLDVSEAARATKSSRIVARLDSMEKAHSNSPPLVAYADALKGGNARAGQRAAVSGPSAPCVKCHNFGTGEGASVGPPLRNVASRLTREQLLESLIDPSASIAPGYGPVQVTLKGGQKLFGTLKEETDSYIVIDAGTSRKVTKADITKRTNGPSAMPPMGSVLTRREIRDVVEYLTTLK